MRWWENTGKQSFPLLYLLACIVLPLLESNGSQERAFSTATWLDGKLNNRQSEETFQMKVVLHQNLPLLKRTEKTIKEHYKEKAKKATKSLLKTVQDFRDQLPEEEGVEQDDDDKDLLEAFESD